MKRKDETDRAARLRAETRNASESDISQSPPSSDQNTHSSISDHSPSDLSTLSHSAINCPSSHSDDDDDNHNFPEDSSEPENDFDYSGHQDDSGPWDRDDLDDNNVPAAHALEDAPANPLMAHELPVNDLSTPLDWNIEDEELLPTAFRENQAVRLLYMQTLVANIFDSRTVLASNTQLSNGLDLLEATGLALEQSVKPATTLPTVRRRLGMNCDDYIEKIPQCNKCYKNYMYEGIEKLMLPTCTIDKCKGSVYRVKRISNSEQDEGDPIEK